MPDETSKAKRLTDEQKTRILYLAGQGTPTKDIAAEMNLAVMKVHGCVQSAINLGKLNPEVARPGRAAAVQAAAKAAAESFLNSENQSMPPAADPQVPVPQQEAAAPQYQPAVQVTPPPPPVPRPQVPRLIQPPVLPAPSYNDGFSVGRNSAGYNGGWNNPQQIVRYQVERKVPYDGIVGQHTAPFTEGDLCQMYGEGLYKVLRHEPGRPVPTEFDVKVGPNFGPPKYPRQGVSSNEGRNRPSGLNRWDRQGQGQDQGEDEPRRAPSFGHDRSLSEYMRQAPVQVSDGSASVAASAIDALSRANERAISQADKVREHGPESFVANFLKSSQDLQNDRWERERQQTEERRREERQTSEERRKEEQERWERRQKEVSENHKQELERIRTDGEAKAKIAAEERKMIMELEDKKLQVIREEHRIRQDQMAEELRLNREQSKLTEERLAKQLAEVKEKTEEQIAQTQESVKEELSREKSQIDREFDLRKSSLEKEQQLNEKILEIRGEQLQQQGGNEVFNTINTLIKEFSKGLEKVVELKKVQSSSPEAQVAMVAAGATQQASEGNVRVETEEKPPQEARQEQGGNVNMEKLIQDMMDEPFFKEVMKEWALHVQEEADPTTFANMYIEWMRDPERHQARQACSMFANVMKVRNWKRMLAILEPKLSAEVMVQFRKPYATDFYDGFKTMVLEQIRVYWQAFLEEQARIAEEKKAGNGHPAPVAVAPAPAAKGPQAIEEDEPGPPLPTREALKSRSSS
jgi:hypothetical protein